jgi:hypothetical protein
MTTPPTDWPERTKQAVQRLREALVPGTLSVVRTDDLALLLADYEREVCGGCKGLGAHRRHCPHSPEYNRWRELADEAEDIGDRIGPNDHGLANTAYALSSSLRKMAGE